MSVHVAILVSADAYFDTTPPLVLYLLYSENGGSI